MSERRTPPWPLLALGAACAVAIVAAALLVGPAPAGQSTVTRTAQVARGVVQSTVSGSGNLAPASQLDLGFSTAGTVTHIYVHAGEQVAKGELLATIDPQSAEVTLQQGRANLQSAEASLAAELETEGEGTSRQSSTSGAATASSGTRRAPNANASAATAAPAGTTTSPTAATTAARTPAATTMTPATATPAPATSTNPAASTGPGATTTPTATTTPAATSTPAATTTPAASTTPSSSTRSTTTKPRGTGTGATSGESSSKLSAATRAANIASARAAVRSDRLTVQSDEQAVGDTRLIAPEDGTIASLSGQVGEVVSGSGTRSASESSSSSSSSATSRSASSPAASSSSSSSSSSSFAVLSDLTSMRLVVPLSESEISSVHRGEIATVTVEALQGSKLAAHVGEVAILSTSNSGVVSYDVTFVLDQMDAALKPGMSASAEVVVKQASGLNVPSSAVTGGTVTVLNGSRRETRRVTTGLAGDSSTIVTSGLSAGETVLLPSTAASSSSGSVSSGLRRLRGLGGGLGGALGGAAGAGGPIGAPGGGGGAFPKGGG